MQIPSFSDAVIGIIGWNFKEMLGENEFFCLHLRGMFKLLVIEVEEVDQSYLKIPCYLFPWEVRTNSHLHKLFLALVTSLSNRK